MELEKLHPESSQVTRTKFLPKIQTLEVEFKSNKKVYHYTPFSAHMWENLLKCESIGSFINKVVKPFCEFKLIEPKKDE